MAFGAMAALMVGLLLSRTSELRWPTVAGWVMGLAVLPWLQWMLGISLFAGDALLTTYFLSGWAIAIFLGYHFVQGDGQQSVLALMHMLWVAALVSAMIGLVQWFRLEASLGIYVTQTDAGDRAMGNLAQPNQLATLLLMGMVALGYVFERRVIGPVGFMLGVAFMTAVLVLTQSKAGMLGVAAIFGFYWAKQSRIVSRLRVRYVLSWALLFAITSALLPSISRALMLGSERSLLAATSERILVWQQTLEGITKSPWVGYGWNQTPTAHMAGVSAYPGTMTFHYAHNVLLDIVAWNGIPLGLVLIGLGAYWFCTRLFRLAGLEAFYAMACLLPFTIHSLVEFPFAYAYFLFAAGLLMGVVEVSMQVSKGWHINRIWSGSALVLWIILGCFMVAEYLLIEEDYRVSRFENYRVGKTEPSYQVPDIRLFSHLAAMQRASRQRPVPGMTASQLDDLRRAALRFPHGALGLRYALALGLNGDPVGARRMMAVVHGMYGEGFYSAAKEVWSDTAEKYPQLGKLDGN